MATFGERIRGLFTRDDAPQHDASIAQTIPSRVTADTSVTVADAVSLSSVYRAISIHAVAAKQLSIDAYRGDVKLTPDQTPSWLKQPDLDSTFSAFLEQTVVSLACQGNAYWRIERGDRGVTNLSVLNPLDVLIQVNAAGKVTAYSYAGTTYSPADIQQLRLLRVPGTPYGLGPVQAAQRELRGALDVRDFAGNWFTGSGVPASGYLASDQPLNTDLAKQTRDAWTAATADRTGVPVLGSGVKFTSLYLSPSDALWIDARQFDVTAVARLFGIPASLMLAALEGAPDTYQNLQQVWTEFVRFSLMGYLREVEQAFSALLPRGTTAVLNVESLLRADTQTRYTTYQLGITSGWLLRSEVRAIEGLPPVSGIDDAPVTPAPTPTPEASNV